MFSCFLFWVKPALDGVPSLHGTAVNVSGESREGSGIQPKNLEFNEDLFDTGGTPVHAIVYPEFGKYIVDPLLVVRSCFSA